MPNREPALGPGSSVSVSTDWWSLTMWPDGLISLTVQLVSPEGSGGILDLTAEADHPDPNQFILDTYSALLEHLHVVAKRPRAIPTVDDLKQAIEWCSRQREERQHACGA